LGSTEDQRGTATLEAALILPIFFLLILASLLFGYYIFVKLLLTYHVHRESEKLAVKPDIQQIGTTIWNAAYRPTPPALSPGRFKGYSFGAPIGEHAFVVSVGCYPLPFHLPKFRFQPAGKASEPPSAKDWSDRVQSGLQAARGYIANANEAVTTVESAVDYLSMVQQIVSAGAAKDAPHRRKQAVRFLTGWAAEELSARACSPNGEWVVSARAVAWSEKAKVLH
jgi:hypothetical protein